MFLLQYFILYGNKSIVSIYSLSRFEYFKTDYENLLYLLLSNKMKPWKFQRIIERESFYVCIYSRVTEEFRWNHPWDKI